MEAEKAQVASAAQSTSVNGLSFGADFTLRGIDTTETAAIDGSGFEDLDSPGSQGSPNKQQYRELKTGRNVVNAQVSALQSRAEVLRSQTQGLEDRQACYSSKLTSSESSVTALINW